MNLLPTRKECQEAACWECLGFYSDGKQDCENTRCPNYSYMPYRKKQPDLWWTVYATKRKGKVKKIDSKPNIDTKTREAARRRMLDLHAKKAAERQKE